MDDAQPTSTAGTGDPVRGAPRLPAVDDAAFAAALDDALDVFYGQATTAEARFYARLPATAADPNWQLTGEVVGPFSHRTRCLPATVKFRRPLGSSSAALSSAVLASPGPSQAADLLVEAAVPDPCFWQPEQPYYYEVSLRLLAGQQTLATVRRQLGLRPLGTHGRRFYMQGKPWVVRAVTPGAALAADALPADVWQDALDLGTTLLVAQPPAKLCEQAHRRGVLLMAALDQLSDGALAQECRRLAQHPAVGLLLLNADAPWSDACRAAARNLLVGCRLDPSQQAAERLSSAVPPRAQFVALRWPAELSPQAYADLAAQLALPVCVEQTPDSFTTLAAAKTACDRLQRALAGLGQFAGYLC